MLSTLLLSTCLSIIWIIPTESKSKGVEDFEKRQKDYIDAHVGSSQDDAFDRFRIILEASRGEPITEDDLNLVINDVITRPTGDFELADLVRFLFLSDDSYDDQVLNGIQATTNGRMWITQGESQYNYWTENHIILWTSSAYLLRQRFPNDPRVVISNDPNFDLDKRLNAWLDAKIAYGYYEAYSSVYFGYTMGALLNLAQFADDPDIKSKANEAVIVLLKGVIINVNDRGAYFPAQARSNLGRFEGFFTAGNSNHINIIWLLTGKGYNNDPAQVPPLNNNLITSGAVAVATTNSDILIDVLKGNGEWKSKINGKSYVNGHPLSEFLDDTAYPTLSSLPLEQTVMQLSAGIYWINSDFAQFTNNFVTTYGLFQANSDFDLYPIFAGLTDPPPSPPFAPGTSYVDALETTQGGARTPFTTYLYKDGPVLLSSMQNYNVYRFGGQQFPFGATTGTVSVYGFSGPKGFPLDRQFINFHLPNIKQIKNAALIKYDSTLIARGPSNTFFYAGFLGQILSIDPADIPLVSIWFPTARFTEVVEDGNWYFAKQTFLNDEGYIALRRDDNCIFAPNSDNYIVCDEIVQYYVIIVGSKKEYKSFDDFQKEVNNEASLDTATDTLKWKSNIITLDP